jgi:small-conductance mechanosensitive channel
MFLYSANDFHQKSYEDRIQTSKRQIKCLITLYINSHEIHGDPHQAEATPKGSKRFTSAHALKIGLLGLKKVAQTTTTIFGTVASELAGERILQPNSPASMVTSALGSVNKTKILANRIFYSFVPSNRNYLVLTDIARYFKTTEEADFAFGIFDRDENGDATLEEVELACLEIHRERLSLADSMRDLDSAVGRLNAIIMSVWTVFGFLVIIALLDVGVNTFLASAGTLLLSLTWLIGSTSQEILTAIVFLFVKHPYDVGDRVDIGSDSYVVKEMQLLSTIFKRLDGKIVQMPHNSLNGLAVVK